MKILIADDSATNRAILNVLTTQLGHQPILAEDGAQAVAAFERELPDALQELLARDMAGGLLGAFAQLQRVVESVAEEVIRVRVVAGILFEDVVESFTEFKFLHSSSANEGATGSIALARV